MNIVFILFVTILTSFYLRQQLIQVHFKIKYSVSNNIIHSESRLNLLTKLHAMIKF